MAATLPLPFFDNAPAGIAVGLQTSLGRTALGRLPKRGTADCCDCRQDVLAAILGKDEQDDGDAHLVVTCICAWPEEHELKLDWQARRGFAKAGWHTTNAYAHEVSDPTSNPQLTTQQAL